MSRYIEFKFKGGVEWDLPFSYYNRSGEESENKTEGGPRLQDVMDSLTEKQQRDIIKEAQAVAKSDDVMAMFDDLAFNITESAVLLVMKRKGLFEPKNPIDTYEELKERLGE